MLDCSRLPRHHGDAGLLPREPHRAVPPSRAAVRGVGQQDRRQHHRVPLLHVDAWRLAGPGGLGGDPADGDGGVSGNRAAGLESARRARQQLPELPLVQDRHEPPEAGLGLRGAGRGAEPLLRRRLAPAGLPRGAHGARGVHRAPGRQPRVAEARRAAGPIESHQQPWARHPRVDGRAGGVSERTRRSGSRLIGASPVEARPGLARVGPRDRPEL
mmetsp:Transcript_14838/g.42761  ORF Transcript_14838/g.42761 Transcript_14838/m.42761 type:complete len:215 (+) Transcript_14838:892-1536(+)